MTKIFLQTILVCLTLFFVQCTNEQTTVETAKEVTEAVLQESKEVLMPELNIDTMAVSEEEKAVIMEGEKEREEAIKKNIEASPLKEKTCEEIFAEYKEVAEEYLSTNDEKALLKLSDWTNDVIYLSCIKKEPFKAKFEELSKKINTAGEKDEDDLF